MNGFVCLNKPQGITSFVAAARVKRIFKEKKAGHTGTLDPMATGVLPVALCGAAKFIELIPTHDKSYRASFVLGKTTDTLDITGTVLTESAVNVSRSGVESVLSEFTGEIMQLPPMYSALKKDGVRLYELARQGIEVEREKRKVSIYSLALAAQNNNEYTIDVSCSAGTYIRSLISDIGERLGCGAVMTALCRTAANGISLERCFTLEQLEKLKEENRLSQAVIPVDKMLSYPGVFVTEAQARRFSNGGGLDLERVRCEKEDGLRLVYSPDRQFLGVGRVNLESGVLEARKVLNRDQSF